MPKTSATKARQSFSDIINRAAYAGERVVIQRRKKPVAAVVSLDDLDLLRKIEDKRDLEDARRALKEPRGKTAKQLRKELGF